MSFDGNERETESRNQQCYSRDMVHGNSLTKEGTEQACWVLVIGEPQNHTRDAEQESDHIGNGDVCEKIVYCCVHEACSFYHRDEENVSRDTSQDHNGVER